MPAFPGFVGGSYRSQSPWANLSRTVNWYVEKIEDPAAPFPAALYPTPGVGVFKATTVSRGRAMFYQNNRVFCIFGDTLYELFEDTTLTSRGTVSDSLEPATIVSNGDGGGQLGIASNGHFYSYDLTTNALTEVASTGADMCAMLDGFGVFLDRASSTVRATELYDMTAVDPVSYAQRSIAGDRWLSIIATRRELWFLGEQTSEVWYNNEGIPFPFGPHPSGLVQTGIAAPYSVEEVGGSLMWLARTKDGQGEVVMAQGFQVRVVSDHALRWALAQYSRIDDAIGETYEDQGHTFYVLTFPEADATWVYDLTTGLWSERGTWSSAEGRYLAWQPLLHVFAWGKHLVADLSSTNIYEMSITLPNDANGDPIRRERTAPALFANGKRIKIRRFELHVEPGLGITGSDDDTPGVNPEVELLTTDDAKTWLSCGNRSIGRKGKYDARPVWTRLGASDLKGVRIVVSEPVPYRVVGATFEVRSGGMR